jgi:hypothetical protein
MRDDTRCKIPTLLLIFSVDSGQIVECDDDEYRDSLCQRDHEHILETTPTALSFATNRIAEVLADLLLAVRRHQDADSVAKFEHQVRSARDPHRSGKRAGGVLEGRMVSAGGPAGFQPHWPCPRTPECSRGRPDR